MPDERDRYRRLGGRVMSIWNTQDVDAVLGCYVEDLVYQDPNTREPVRGRDAMRAYLTKLFSRWTMRWEPGEIFPLDGIDGVTLRWTGTLARAGESRAVDVAGLDLVLLEGDLVKRNEVYFDRSLLAELFTSTPA